MYKNKIVVSLKTKNIPLLEDKEGFFIPFNTEYSIYMKNMSEETALISLFVNGRDVSPGEKIKIRSKSSATIEKFRDTDHRFIFKEKTLQLQEVRLNNDEDGLIRLEVDFDDLPKINNLSNSFQNNKQKSNFGDIHTQLFKSSNKTPITKDNGNLKNNSVFNNPENIGIYRTTNTTELNCSYDSKTLNPGLTLPGRKKESEDNVNFEKDKYQEKKSSESFSFLIKLKETEDLTYKKEKKLCPTCKKKFKYKYKYFFCPYDGTSLD